MGWDHQHNRHYDLRCHRHLGRKMIRRLVELGLKAKK
jgi:hypothetical protein